MVKRLTNTCMFSVIALMIAFTLTIYYVSETSTKLTMSWTRDVSAIRQKFGSSAMSRCPRSFHQATHLDHPYHPDGRYHRLYPVNCSAVFQGNTTHLTEISVMLSEQKSSKKTLVPSDSEVSRIMPKMFFLRYTIFYYLLNFFVTVDCPYQIFQKHCLSNLINHASFSVENLFFFFVRET